VRGRLVRGCWTGCSEDEGCCERKKGRCPTLPSVLVLPPLVDRVVLVFPCIRVSCRPSSSVNLSRSLHSTLVLDPSGGRLIRYGCIEHNFALFIFLLFHRVPLPTCIMFPRVPATSSNQSGIIYRHLRELLGDVTIWYIITRWRSHLVFFRISYRSRILEPLHVRRNFRLDRNWIKPRQWRLRKVPAQTERLQDTSNSRKRTLVGRLRAAPGDLRYVTVRSTPVWWGMYEVFPVAGIHTDSPK